MDPTKEYYSQRLGIIWRVVNSMEKKSYNCDFLKNLSNMNGGGKDNKEGVVVATYPVALSIVTKGKKQNIPLFVKETRAGYEEKVPYLTLMELYILKNVIYKMFSRNISPHFSFPVYQLVLDTGFVVDDSLIDGETGMMNKDNKFCGANRTGNSDDVAIYSFTEYLDPRINVSMFEFITLPQSYPDDFRACMFQILYNLACMEDIKLRHGDLHLKNIMVTRMYPYTWTSKYTIDESHQYLVHSPVFIYFIDFDRSSLHGDDGVSLKIPDSVLSEAVCVSPSLVGHEKMTPNGTVEDCWNTWNPYADFTRVFQHILYRWNMSPKAFEILFPDFSLKTDVIELLGDFRGNLYGRPSISEISKNVRPEVLSRTTPKELFKRYSEQYIGHRGEFSIMRVSTDVPYPSFGLNM